MKTITHLLPTAIAYILSGLLFQNFVVFTMSLGSLWINIQYYWVLCIGLFLSIINYFLPRKVLLYIYGFIFTCCLCFIAISAIESLQNLKYMSLLVFITIFAGTTFAIKKREWFNTRFINSWTKKQNKKATRKYFCSFFTFIKRKKQSLCKQFKIW